MKNNEKTNTMKLIERIYNKDIEDILKEDYLGNKMSIQELSKKYGVSTCTIHAWLKTYDIPRRKLTFI